MVVKATRSVLCCYKKMKTSSIDIIAWLSKVPTRMLDHKARVLSLKTATILKNSRCDSMSVQNFH